MTGLARRTPWLAGLTCLIGLVLTGLVTLRAPAGANRDALTLKGFQSLDRPRLTGLADHLAHSVDPRPYLLIAAILVAIAALRGRPRLAVGVVVALGASGATSELLKPLLAEHRHYLTPVSIAPGSWPSGHATAAMSVALCAVLVSPRRLRAVVAAAGTALAIGVSYSVLILSWHFPSDVLGGFLVSATWVCLVVGVLREIETHWPPRRGCRDVERTTGVLAPVALVACAAGVLLLVLLARPGIVATYEVGHRSFLAGAFAIAALAWILATGLAAGLSLGNGRAPTGVPAHRWPRG